MIDDSDNVTTVQQLYVPERMRWIDHQGKRILVHDYSDLSAEDTMGALIENSAVAAALGRNDLLLLVIVTGLFANKKLVKLWKEKAKKNNGLYKKVAVIGATGLLGTLMRAINKASGGGSISFEHIEEAKDWLVSDSV